MGYLLEIARKVQIQQKGSPYYYEINELNEITFSSVINNSPSSPVVDNKPSTEKNAHTPKDNLTTAAIVEPGTNTAVIWRNPYPQGTPEARQASLGVVIEAMLFGFSPVDDEQTRRINDIARDVLTGKAKLADLRCLLGLLH